tara:strand:- start:1094 stop:2395 length:1302 start_codon:yes stop_codon:yes gene_type:complete
MAADPYLIAGQRAVSQAQAENELAQSRGTQAVINAGLNALTNIVGKKKVDANDWTEQSHKILDKAGELPNAEYLSLYDNLDNEIKEQYNQAVIDGDKKKQAMILKDIADMGRDYADYKDYLYTLAQDNLSGTLSNNMLHYDREGMEIMKLLNADTARLVRKPCEEGVPCDVEMGIMLPNFEIIDEAEKHVSILENQINTLYRQGDFDGDGNWIGDYDMMESLQAKLEQYNAVLEDGPEKWTSLQTIKSKTKRKDKSSADIIEATLQQSYNNGYNSTVDDPSQFDMEHARQKFENSVLADGDFKSLIYDEMIPGRNFYDDFLKMIKGEMAQGLTYSDLGVTDEQLADADVNKDDIIDDEEAENIAQFIINDNTETENGKSMIHEYVSNYFLNIFKRNHEKGLTNMMNLNKNKNNQDNEDNINSSSFNSNISNLT